MATPANQFKPDYAVPPGWVLQEHLEVLDMSQAEFARRCDRSAKLIREIIAGKASIDPQTALQFEKVLGLKAHIWLGIETDYRLHLARKTEAETAASDAKWAKSFPIRELVTRNVIDKPASDADAVSKLLAFFGVASQDAWQRKYEAANVVYRHSASFSSDDKALATWLRIGEMQTEREECAAYNKAAFRQALQQIRQITQTSIDTALDEAQRLCKDSGVLLIFVKPLPRMALSGASWWLSPRKAVIQLSARHKSDDQLWFSLFHEAAHILLHSKKYVFIHETNKEIGDREPEDDKAAIEAAANQWAADFLVSPRQWERFIASSVFTERAIRRFAKEQRIAPGIIVGRLQHEELVPWSRLNKLKVKLKWKKDANSG